ncbi:cytoplasmic polyadenylation element-binding protein 2-like isoform X2 [Pollicipes pollicipes]|uniref:cytoplasmic polyadenylation element-binding protein 2-like isoform X2 n=1 Tax=Pollicipes pollicipes TaxID=41117 RepID=UPI0018854D87|nr:cytoplasmic polyadenylation element-binding protein 2-like isoform X2 [Pollicipes pollicipes]
MGDLQFNVSPNISAICSDIAPSTTTDASFFVSSSGGTASRAEEQRGRTMHQDDFLVEKPQSKSPPQSSANSEALNSDGQRYCEDSHNLLCLGGVLGNHAGVQDKLKGSDRNGLVHHSGITQNASGASGLSSNVGLGNSQQLGPSYSETSPIMMNGSLSGSPSSLWSTGSVEDNFLTGMQAFNSASYQNPFPGLSQTPNSNPGHLLGAGFGAQMSMQQPTQSQRRAITGSHNMPPNRPPNPYLAGKSYPAWPGVNVSQPQQSSWGGNIHQAQHSMGGMQGWNRGRQVPNMSPLSPISTSIPANMVGMNRKYSPTFNQGSGGVGMSPNKFRRSTSYPGRPFGQHTPSFELTGADDKDLLAYQERNGMCPPSGVSPLDSMRTLEHYLNDMVRGAGDHGYANCGHGTMHSLAQLHGKPPFYPGLDESAHLLDEHGLLDGLSALSPSRTSPRSSGSGDNGERYSRKVFVGGLPPDIDEEEITTSFRRFGPLVVDWPHKAESKSYFPPKGYAFLLFQDECSVQQLIDTCIQDDDKLYLCVSSPTIKDKPVQIRPWKLSDADYVLDASLPLDPRKTVFVGGVPRPLKAEEITTSFRRFGPLVVDWPHKAESKSYFPPKGYAFLLFQDECSVQQLIDTCIQDDDKLYLCVSSPTIKDKPVQIRPWKLSDADYVLDASLPLDPRKTVFVGGVPRPLKAVELAMIMDRLYGGVCYAGIDTDPELKYPKGAGRVAFSNQQSYIAAISARFVQLQHGDIDKRVEVKPYVLDDQMCDECQGTRCGGKFAPFFCANVTCLQYYCEHCWATIHSRPGREFHKPLVKEGADRPRAVPYRWC